MELNQDFYNSLAVPITHIIKNIYIGNLLGGIDKDEQDLFSIDGFVRVIEGDYFSTEKPTLQIPIDDNEEVDILKYVDSFLNFIKQNSDKNILIHCQHGSSRSGTFVLLYLMAFHNMSFEEALEFARTKRLGINPNKGFCTQLKSISNNQV